jgi:hypothetical protein
VATLALLDIEPDLLEELARRARQLGTTVEREALRALREHLAEPARPLVETTSSSEPIAQTAPNARAGETLTEDPRFLRQHGLWVFADTADPRMIPDHRDIREERIDSFVKAALGEDSD